MKRFALVLLALFGRPGLAATESPRSFAELFSPDIEFPYFANAGAEATSLQDADRSFSIQQAAFFGQFSLLVYVPDEGFVRKQASRAGFEEARFVEQHGSQAWVFRSTTDVVIVFRGTEPQASEDILTDLRFLPARFDDRLAAHRGFIEATSALLPLLDAEVERAGDRRVWLTGHSLGGALAQLYGWKQRLRVNAVYTFGSPRVFTTACAEMYDPSVRCYRIVNNNDVVPHVPTPPVYTHVGEEWFVDAAGDLQCEPALLDRLDAYWQGHRNYVDAWLAHWREKQELKWTPGDGLADHAPAAYAAHLVALAVRARRDPASDL